MKKDMEDYLQEGIYGAKEINPAERKKFLGTLRERVVLALTKGQVMKGKGITQLNQLMQENQGAKLLLNGNVSYRFFKQYKKMASNNNIPYTTVKNKNAKSNFGLILTYDHAIDKENIYLNEEIKEEKPKKKRSFFSSLFNW